MLGTLIKHEWKYIWKKMLLFLLATVGATIVGIASFASIGKVDNEGDFASTVIVVLGLIGYYGIIMCVAFGFLILSGVRFYKNVYGDEAYITHTLPVTAGQIHLSKVLVYGICSVITTAAMVLSILMVVQIGFSQAAAMDGEVVSIFELFENAGLIKGKFLFVTVLMFIVSGFSNVTCVFCSVVLGQYWKQHRVVGAIIWYVIITFITSMVSSICMIPVMGARMVDSLTGKPVMGITLFSVSTAPSDFMYVIFVMSAIVCILIGAACYFVANYGMNKKLNLE